MAEGVQLAKPPARRRRGLEWPHFAAWQWKVLSVLTLLNLFNYFDRQIIFPMFDLLKDEFDVSDFRLGLLGSVFILVHSLAVLPFGYWADRGPRQKIMAGGVFFWSAATMLSGAAATFNALVGTRALVGVGEAAYAPAGTAMISDTFPPDFRARVQSVFNLGMLVGGVLGLAVGGVLAQEVGWRIAFLLVALPGLLLAVACYRLRVPHSVSPITRPSIGRLVKNSSYLLVLVGGAFAAFTAATFITWGAVFGIRYHDLSVAQAAVWMGLLVLLGSLVGVLVGGYIADRLQARWAWGRALTTGVTLLLGTPFLLAAVMTDSRAVFFSCTFLATALLTCYHGPTTAVIHDLTPSDARALAFGVYLFVIHLLGDTIAPALIGRVSDLSELRRGLLIGVAANFLAAVFLLMVAYLIRRRALAGAPPRP